MTKIGTFEVRGNLKLGYWLVDTCKFNNWGVLEPENGDAFFKTCEEAEEYARRCHDFKMGRRMYV